MAGRSSVVVGACEACPRHCHRAFRACGHSARGGGVGRAAADLEHRSRLERSRVDRVDQPLTTAAVPGAGQTAAGLGTAHGDGAGRRVRRGELDRRRARAVPRRSPGGDRRRRRWMLRSPPLPIACWSDSASAPVPALPQAVRDRLDSLSTTESLAAIPDGPAKDARRRGRRGRGGGDAGGARRRRPLRAVPAHRRAPSPGEWRPVPPAFAIDPNSPGSPRSTRSRCSSSRRSSARTGPRNLNSGAYAHEYDEVKELGAVNSARSPEQEAIARSTPRQPVGAVQPHVPDHLRRRRG